ncbi:MAG: AtpZ/AtpI family protein [Salegentibacter sp.]|uniref:ATP synthase protein I n=1 Tax=Salegentibacter flavus TaxID=287099 RepID=A0A1I4Y9R2_9FLAO|nr:MULTISPECIES: AtpZ/AtpI family protein [Salegentibacter]MDR9456933.1 AtpZ/AtpI family protein [Salegentibacter sp.]SFN34784.1 ATP synthase protein I [Salegentibacter flavus]
MAPANKKNKGNAFSQQVGKKERRKLKALRDKKKSIWSGLGMFGMVGWSVAVPTLLGTILGIWLDKNYPQSFSWTLTFLVIGLLIGCLIAWFWVANEDREMNPTDKDEELNLTKEEKDE